MFSYTYIKLIRKFSDPGDYKHKDWENPEHEHKPGH